MTCLSDLGGFSLFVKGKYELNMSIHVIFVLGVVGKFGKRGGGFWSFWSDFLFIIEVVLGFS